jgi:transcription elongation factor Elf1
VKEELANGSLEDNCILGNEVDEEYVPIQDKQPKKRGRPLERVPCDICGKILVGASKAKYHAVEVHSNYNSVDCDICGKTLKNKGNQKLHILSAHEKYEKPYQCHICTMSFRVKSMLQNHIETVHDKSRQFQCPYCEIILSNKFRFNRHSKRRHGGINLPQNLLDKSTSDP